MKLSTLIEEAQKAYDEHGDITVVIWSDELDSHFIVDYVEAAEFVLNPADETEDAFALVIAHTREEF